MRVIVRGHNLPGRTFCGPEGDRGNVHVGVQERTNPTGLIAGDAPSAEWEVGVRVQETSGGGFDYKGPAVHGRRGERFLYLTWGDVSADGRFDMFRRAKLMLHAVSSELVRAAERDGRPLVATVDLTDERGGPRCARVGPPALTWTLASRR